MESTRLGRIELILEVHFHHSKWWKYIWNIYMKYLYMSASSNISNECALVQKMILLIYHQSKCLWMWQSWEEEEALLCLFFSPKLAKAKDFPSTTTTIWNPLLNYKKSWSLHVIGVDKKAKIKDSYLPAQGLYYFRVCV